MTGALRASVRRAVPRSARLRLHVARLRAAHLPMRVRPGGRAARARLAALRDAHRGETCVILGNGPSLERIDVGLLDGIPTFCLNRGYLLWEGSGRSPTFYVAVNDLVIGQFDREIAALDCPLFLPWIHRQRFADAADAVFFELRTDQRFVTDVTRGVAPAGTVTIAALQLAYHLGFATAVLLGVDHRFATPGRPHQEVRQNGDDPNHFRGDYFGDGVAWNLPDLRQSERGYERARAAFEADGRRIVNATPDSALDVFERGALEVLAGGVSD